MKKKKEKSTWGSIRQRGKTSWEIRYTVNGKPNQETVRGTRAQAERRKAELRIKYEGTKEGLTLSQFWDYYYYPEIQDRLALSTVVGYENLYNSDLKPALGDYELKDISPRDIQSWIDPMTTGKAKHARALISGILSRAFALAYIDDNPARRRFIIKKGKRARKRSEDVFTIDELEYIFNNSSGEIWRPAFILSAFGGASREESVSPKLDEIEFIDGWAYIPILRGVQRLKRKIEIIPVPKNEFRERDLIIPPKYASALYEIVEDGKRAGEIWLSDDGTGNVMCPNRIANSYKLWFLNQDIGYIPFGNLRNSYGTVTQGIGVDGLMVSKIMGHAEPGTYYRHYFRPSTEDKQRALNRALGKSGHNDENNEHLGNKDKKSYD